MQRFFIPAIQLQDSAVHLVGTQFEQITRVLRMKPGDMVAVFIGDGAEHIVRLERFGKREIEGVVTGTTFPRTEAQSRIELYLSLLNKPEKFEWALQKCTELGVARFVPVAASRSVSQSVRRERWERILQEAAEQCGRVILPTLSDAMSLSSALDEAVLRTGIALMPEVGAEKPLLQAAGDAHLKKGEGIISVFIGPEGGFSPDEQAFAANMSATLVSLGPRVLRAETAALASVTLALAATGALG